MTTEEEMFSTIDANKSGTIEDHELLKYLIQSGFDEQSIGKLFAALDTNADGHISREEWATGYPKYSAARSEVASNVSALRKWLTDEIDVAKLIAQQLAPLLGEKDALSYENVRGALTKSTDKIAGTIAHEATMAAAHGRAEPWRTQQRAKTTDAVDAGTDPARKKIVEACIETQRREKGTAGAEKLFGSQGIHPTWWGVSKEQFKEFISAVRHAPVPATSTPFTPSPYVTRRCGRRTRRA